MQTLTHQHARTLAVDRSESLITLLKALVEMPTITTDRVANRAAIAWIKQLVHALPLLVSDFKYKDYEALILTTRQTKRPKVLLSAHIDVIPADPREFVFREENGRYYGRGTFDMKFAAATYLDLLLKLGDKLPQYDLGVVFTTDEEVTAGAEGAGPLVEAGWGGGVIINPDAVTPSWTIQRAGKGLIRYSVTCEGESGHGSRTWMHKNAIIGIMDYLHDLRAQFPKEPCGDEEHAHDTLNIGLIHGGQIVNQIAENAYAEIDVRITPGLTFEEMTRRIEQLRSKHPGIKLNRLIASDPVVLDLNLPYVKQLQAIITKVTGNTNKPHLAHGGSEASFYAARGMPVLLFEGPGGNNHASGEWLDAAGLEQFSEIIRLFVEQEAR